MTGGERLMSQVGAAVRAIREAVGINVACSLGILTAGQAAELAALGVHRYNHNLETARSYFGQIMTTHGWQERYDTCELVKSAGMELCCDGVVGMGEEAGAAGGARLRARRPRARRGRPEDARPPAHADQGAHRQPLIARDCPAIPHGGGRA
jgi:hypothetical protein